MNHPRLLPLFLRLLYHAARYLFAILLFLTLIGLVPFLATLEP